MSPCHLTDSVTVDVFGEFNRYEMRCCFNSMDEDNFSRLSITIPPLGSRYTAVRCDGFTANCNIRVLTSRDFITMTINGAPVTVNFDDDYTNLNAETFAGLLNDKLNESHGVGCEVDNCNRIYMYSEHPFWFNSVTYNVKLLLGLYAVKEEDIRAEKIRAEQLTENTYRLQINSVGMYLSTPILNLVSNIGDPSLRNNSDDLVNIQSCNTVLRINNSFSPNVPIVATGDGKSSIVPSGYVSGAVFILVDANMRQVDLLSPMYISLTLEPLNGYDI